MSATARLMAFLGMDASQFTGGVDKAEKRVSSFGKSLEGMKGKIAAAFTVGAAMAAVKSVAGKSSDIADTAENLAITTDEFQALSIAAKQFGFDSGDVATALSKMAAAQAEFVSGSPSQELVDRMQALGISLDQADAVNAAEFFEAVAKGATTSADGLDAAIKILGRGGAKFRAYMQLVSGVGLGGLVSGAKGSGELISEADITATDAVVDGLVEQWKNKVIKAAATVVGAVAGAVTSSTKVATETSEAQAERNRKAREKADEKEAAKISADAAEIRKKNEYDALDAAGKLLAVKAEIAALDEKISNATTQTAKAEADKQRAELEGKLQGLEEQQQGPGMAYDQLRRIGAGVFRGTADNAVAKRQLDVQTKMEKHLANLTQGEKRELGRF